MVDEIKSKPNKINDWWDKIQIQQINGLWDKLQIQQINGLWDKIQIQQNKWRNENAFQLKEKVWSDFCYFSKQILNSLIELDISFMKILSQCRSDLVK